MRKPGRVCALGALGAFALFGTALQAQETANWSGLYLGVSAGGTSTRFRNVNVSDAFDQVSGLFVPTRGIIIVPATTRPSDVSFSHSLGFAGGQAGFLFQSHAIVFGVEGDIHAGFGRGSGTRDVSLPPTAITPAVPVTMQRSLKMDYDWSARARLGIAMGHTLLYLTGGVAGARIRVDARDTFTDPGGPAGPPQPGFVIPNFGPLGPTVTTASGRRSVIGWTGGAGVAQRIGEHLSIGLEFRHDDYGTHAVDSGNLTRTNTGPTITDSQGHNPNPLPGGTPGTIARISDERVALTLNFHFG
jgi:opacity protein-like surface antigen